MTSQRPIGTDRDQPRTAAPRPRVTRLRYAQTALVALIFAFIGAVPFAWAAAPWGLLALLPLLLGGYFLYRIGADITADEVVIRGAFYTRHVPRSSIIGMDVPDGRHVYLARDTGSAIMLPTARPRDLPRLRELLFDIPMEPVTEDDPYAEPDPLSATQPVAADDQERGER